MLHGEDETMRHGETIEAVSKVMHIVQLVWYLTQERQKIWT